MPTHYIQGMTSTSLLTMGKVCVVIFAISNLSLLFIWVRKRMLQKHSPHVLTLTRDLQELSIQSYVNSVTMYHRHFSCSRIAKGDNKELEKAELFLKQHNFTFPSFSERAFAQVTRDCGDFRRLLGYRKSVSNAESELPLAYTILTHDNIEHVERLLRMVYSPANVYCIHVDLKADLDFLTSVVSLAECFPNVFLASRRVDVVYAHFSRLRAELNCMEDLLSRHKTWKYYLNLASTEIPLNSADRTVALLHELQGRNDIEEIKIWSRSTRWTLRHEVRDGQLVRTKEKHPPPPHNLTMTKGVAYGAFTRQLLEFVFTNKVALDFLNWTRNTFSPDEHFWATLNNIYDNKFLNSPGGSKVPPKKTRYISRFMMWNSPTQRHVCHGKFRHNVCVFGVGDIPLLISYRQKLVANKFDLTFDPIAYSCMEQYLSNFTDVSNT